MTHACRACPFTVGASSCQRACIQGKIMDEESRGDRGNCIYRSLWQGVMFPLLGCACSNLGTRNVARRNAGQNNSASCTACPRCNPHTSPQPAFLSSELSHNVIRQVHALALVAVSLREVCQGLRVHDFGNDMRVNPQCDCIMHLLPR